MKSARARLPNTKALAFVAQGFAPILIILVIFLLIPIAYLVNRQFIGIRYPWDPPVYSTHDGGELTKEDLARFQKQPNTPTPSSDETANWKLVNGRTKGWQDKDFSFQLKVPQDFADGGVDQEYYYNVTGERIKFFAGLMEGPGILSVLYWKADQPNICSNPLKVVNETSGSFEACDIVKVDGKDTLFLIRAYFGGGDGGVCERYAKLFVVRNVRQSSSMLLTVELDEINDAVAPWMKYEKPDSTFGDEPCPPESENNKVQTNLESSVKNIRNVQNLSTKDTETMKTLYQILSTFKFLD